MLLDEQPGGAAPPGGISASACSQTLLNFFKIVALRPKCEQSSLADGMRLGLDCERAIMHSESPIVA